MAYSGTVKKKLNIPTMASRPCIKCKHYNVYMNSGYNRNFEGCFRSATQTEKIDPVSGKKDTSRVYGILDCQDERREESRGQVLCAPEGKFFEQKVETSLKSSFLNWIKRVCLEKPEIQ